MFISLFAPLRKRRAINTFVRKLGPALQRLYGRKRHYSAKQVRRAARDVGISAEHEYVCYAYCIYCSRVAFDNYHQKIGEKCDYDELRAEVSAVHFNSILDFDSLTAIDVGLSHHDVDHGWLDYEGNHFNHSDPIGSADQILLSHPAHDSHGSHSCDQGEFGNSEGHCGGDHSH